MFDQGEDINSIEIPYSTISLLIDNYFYKNNKFEFDESSINTFFYRINQLNLPVLPIEKNSTIKQLYLLHVICSSLLYYNDNKLKMNMAIFNKIIYIPFVFTLLYSLLKYAYKFVIKLIHNSILNIQSNNKLLLDAYFFLYKDNIDIMKMDVLFTFITHIIVNTNPLIIADFNYYFANEIWKLVIYYVKGHIEGIINYKHDPLLFEQGIDMLSDRVKIYEDGYRTYFLHQISKKSDTISKIIDNYNKIKNEILNNELQVLLFKYHYNTSNSNKQSLLILQTSDDDIDIEYIKMKMPIIYLILKCVKIKSNTQVLTKQEQELLKLTIESIMINKFKTLISDNESLYLELTKKITNNLVTSLSNGKFIDPLTLTPVQFNTNQFISQFVLFLEYLFKDI